MVDRRASLHGQNASKSPACCCTLLECPFPCCLNAFARLGSTAACRFHAWQAVAWHQVALLSAAASHSQLCHHWKPGNPAPRLQVWSTKNIDGVHRFLARVWRLIAEQGTSDCEPSQDQMRLLHATIKKVSALSPPECIVRGTTSVRKAQGTARTRCACCMPLSQAFMALQVGCCPPCHTVNRAKYT